MRLFVWYVDGFIYEIKDRSEIDTGLEHQVFEVPEVVCDFIVRKANQVV